ncbi:cupin domain-containing protein [Alicyclobacillus fastidiosus]|uniref:Cupin domain-containing protein n=1 Tax=Alicyclobacillus fastidiosus TaxID=392011 RepID=A0ABV5A9V8_9BACL|nr:cupin domain-containing protein [Alicyclobacillus fastidiosus]WEH10798.1 cupin domain-containing protein [Alicyclobacillus fastidiosus]
MTYLLVFLGAWVCLLLFGDRKQFRRVFPSVAVGVIMSLASDIITNQYPFWKYHDNEFLPPVVVQLLDDFGIYPCIAYLFVQHIPTSAKKWIIYTACWVAGGMGVEWVMAYQGYLTYGLGWNLGWSFAADCAIFIVLTAVYLLDVHRGQRSHLELLGDKQARACLNAPVVPLPNNHPLYHLQNHPGITLLKSVSSLDVETFITVVAPHHSCPSHAHQGHEVHYIVEGNLKFTVGSTELHLHAGDLIDFSSKCPHSCENVSAAPAAFISLLLSDSEIKELNDRHTANSIVG